MTVREQIMAAVGPRLNTGRPVGIPEAIRARTHAIQPGALPVLSYYMGPELIGRAGGHDASPLLTRRLRLIVEAIAKGSSGVTAEEALDPACAWVELQLNDHEFDGLATKCQLVETRPSLEPAGGEENRTPIARMLMVFQVDYTTSSTNPEVTA